MNSRGSEARLSFQRNYLNRNICFYVSSAESADFYETRRAVAHALLRAASALMRTLGFPEAGLVQCSKGGQSGTRAARSGRLGTQKCVRHNGKSQVELYCAVIQ